MDVFLWLLAKNYSNTCIRALSLLLFIFELPFFASAQIDPALALKGGFPGKTKIQTVLGPLSFEEIYEKMSCGEEIFVPSAPEQDVNGSQISEKKISSISFYRPKSITTIKFYDMDSELISSSDQDFFIHIDTDKSVLQTAAKDLHDGAILVSALRGSQKPERVVESVITEPNQENLVLYTISVIDNATYLLDESLDIVHNFNPLEKFPTEAAIHANMVNASFIAGIATFVSLMYIKAPYGRHIKEGWGPTIPNKWAWVLMEIPSVLAFAGTYALGSYSHETSSMMLAALWLSHYCYRTFIFPNLIRSKNKQMPLSIAMTGFGYNTFNSYLNARWISHLGSYPSSWEKDPRFILGSMIFASGLVLNIHSDQILINLRKPGETSYKIPVGGGFDYVSSPNYLGELIEWAGWSIASWSLPGLSFALYTGANLIPRAIANHKWYKEKFPEYPEDRKAIVPKIL